MADTFNPPVTIRDIAAATGLHHTTVSLALRNSPKLRPETLNKIQDMAKKLGYKPNPMLTALNAYRQSKSPPHYQSTIAWINNWPDRDEIFTIATFRQYHEGACDRTRQLGYALEEFWMHQPGMSPERTLAILKARNIQGLLMFPQPYARTLSPFDFRDFSAVAFGYSLQPPVLNVVTNHHAHSMNLILSNLVELGYRRIGLNVSRDWDAKVEHAWVGGLKLSHWTNPELAVIPPLKSESVLGPWLKKYQPDVVISYNELEAEIRALGYSIPEDIGFASLDKEPEDLIISGLNENSFYIGQKAVDALVGLLHRGERGIPAVPTRLLVESTWVPGKTLRRQVHSEARKSRLPK